MQRLNDGRSTTGWLRRAILPVMALALSGCATLRATVGSYATGPGGISRPQQRLRETLSQGDYSAALAWREDDALLNALTNGITRYYGGLYALSGAVLDSAALLADDRITTSLSKGALSLATNDMALAYQPRRTERLFIPYYGMLAYARLGAWEDAAVEARRLSLLLAQYGEDRDGAERVLHAALHRLSGVVFERAGNRGEAEIAYRNAHALATALPDTLTARDSTAGELVVLVERGFVAYRASESIRIDMGDGDDEHRLSIAYAALRRSARVAGGAVHLLAADTIVSVELSATVDDASAADERRERVAATARALARATAKYAMTKAIRDNKGWAAGKLAEAGANFLERADVRSWHLLPQEIALLRTRVPSGLRPVRLRVGSGDDACVIDLGIIDVPAGQIALVPVRLWRDPSQGSPSAAASIASVAK